jgi:hypothetical protein
MRSAVPPTSSSVIIIDNADGLNRQNWEDVLSLVTHEFRASKAYTLILLGLPSLAARMGSRGLMRVRRRVFRTCQLPGMTRAQAEAYVQHRLAAAGGRIEPFTPAALDLVHRVTGGNPALVNQVCDNALIDAFSEDRKTIDGPHVSAAVQSIIGPATNLWRLQPPPVKRLAAAEQSALGEDPYLPSRVSQLLSGAEIDEDAAAPRSVDEAYLASEIAALGGGTLQPVSGDTSGQAVEVAAGGKGGVAVAKSVKTGSATGATSALLVDRLRVVEVRISDALSRVREARTRNAADSRPVKEVKSTDAAK